MLHLFNMLPCSSFNYAPHSLRGNSVFYRDASIAKTFFSETIETSHFPYLVFCYFRMFMILPSLSSSFFGSITHIVHLRSFPKMVRIYARRVIAFMKNHASFLYFPFMKFVRKSMGINLFFNSINSCLSDSISVLFNSRSAPYPTSSGFFSVPPEQLFRWDAIRHIPTFFASFIPFKYGDIAINTLPIFVIHSTIVTLSEEY